MEADFSGYATKTGLKCSDGRTIMSDAFKHNDGITVPLVWQHGHSDPANILGHAVLENRADGVYAYAYFNSTAPAQNAKALVQHKDITQLSIYANQLVERAKQVFHGSIKEVSLVLSGANPGALIDNISLAHADGDIEVLEEEAIIFTGLALEHEDQPADKVDEVVHTDEATAQDVYDAFTDEQKDVVNAMLEHASTADLTVQDVYDSFSQEQLDVVHYMIGAAFEAAQAGSTVQHDDVIEHGDMMSAKKSMTDASAKGDVKGMVAAGTVMVGISKNAGAVKSMNDAMTAITAAQKAGDAKAMEAASKTMIDSMNTMMGVTHTDANKDEGDLTHQEGTVDMTHNVFEQNGITKQAGPTLTHDQLVTIVEDGKKLGSLKESFLSHAVEYGIENIDFLFPDAKTLASSPEMVTRRQEWVNEVINGAKKSPFSRIKTVSTDLTLDQARAKGYVKGALKKEEWFTLQKRVTTPTTVYKKQKLDRDDIVDITDIDVIIWLKAEMRIMLDEEIARAVLVGDGRAIDSPDKVDENCIRPIAYEADFYAHKTIIAANVVGDSIVEAILRARPNYRGTGSPTLFCTEGLLTDLLLVKDKLGRRLYSSLAELAVVLRVSKIVPVPVMESLKTTGGDILAILVNLTDYTMGADKGGNISLFDDFDIDYNQYKYLMETRMSGALTLFKSALVVVRGAGTQVSPTVPTFVPTTGVLTIPAVTGVIYSTSVNLGAPVVATAGTQTAIAAGTSVDVSAAPDAGYYFPHNFDADWTFTRNA